MRITRKFTTRGRDPFASVEWVKRSSRIQNPDGSVVFEMHDAEVPASWSQLATDIMVSKYFRKAGVPQTDEQGAPLLDDDGEPVLGPERSARQVIHRLAGCWRHWGEQHGYFDTAADAEAFYDELAYMLVHQMAAPNSPQWFNTGLNWAYGISGPAQGHFIVDPQSGETRPAPDAYTHPQPHACFIQSVADDLVGEGGIMDLWQREARLFKYGSGTGTNFSSLRAENEPLSGGGKSSGLMSWLKIGDRAAGAIKSGGTTRRAAKMACLDMDHPDIEKFINWKVREELKVAALVEGMKALPGEQKETAERLGLQLDYDFNGEAYATVSGQNANNSVRIPDAFFEAVDDDATWGLIRRTDAEVESSPKARDLWEQIGFAAWRCADPGVQYDSTINAWHTCPESGRINASNPCSEYMFLDNTACNLASINLLKFFDAESKRFDAERYEHAIDLWTIVLEISVLMAAFPSREIARLSFEYRTLGLGYANIGAMLMQAGVAYDSDEARAICGTLTAILTGRSYRQSALLAGEHGAFKGYTPNKEHMLRVIRNHRRAAHGVARDATDQGAGDLGAYEDLKIAPVPIDRAMMASTSDRLANAGDLLERAAGAWDEALRLGETHGYRNAQVSVIAPTGTIGLLMDCDTTGVEPDFALVKFKKLAGGGYFKIANASLEPALRSLGYDETQVRDVMRYVLGALTLDTPLPSPDGARRDAGETLEEFLKRKGLKKDEIERIGDALPSVFELSFALGSWSIGDAALERLGIDPEKAKKDPGFNLLKRLGLTWEQIDALNEVICGAQTVEGAPHLRDEHLPVFDCASTCGRKGTRSIRPEGHIRMMAAAQPFISGAISKTINLPSEASVEDIKDAYRLSWELGLKANALYRDGCKLSQVLSSKSDTPFRDESEGDDEGVGEETAGRGVALSELQLLGEEEDEDAVEAAQEEVAGRLASLARKVGEGRGESAERERVHIVHRPMRRRLPDTRRSLTHKFSIAGHEGYLTVGLYEDGRPGELFVTMAKEGSTIGGLMDSLGTATSVALQYGVPVESLVRKFAHQRFEPAGMTLNEDIPFAKSLVDYIFRWLGVQFVEGYRDMIAPKRGRDANDDAGDDAPEGRMDHGDETARRARLGLEPRHNKARGQVVEPKPAPKNAPHAGGANGDAGRPAGEDVAPGGRAHGGGPQKRTGETGETLPSPTSTLSEAMRDCQSDAPACEVCGEITARNGACYRCLNCGHSMGCS